MNITYTVPKKKYNRISYRIFGIIILVIVLLQIFSIVKGLSSHPSLSAIFSFFLGIYGIYLIYHSLRKQAFDISFTFTDDGLDVKHHYGETHYNFEDIEFVTMVIADEALYYYILNVKTKKDVYTIPFPGKGELCERIYEFVNPKTINEK